MDKAKEYAQEAVAELDTVTRIMRSDLEEEIRDSFLAGALEMDRIYQRDILPYLEPKPN